MEESLFLYSESKAPFDALVQAGEISESRIGIIGETGEIWVKGQYLPIAKDFVKIGKSTDTSRDNTLLGWANGLKSSLDITVKTHQTDDGHTVYRLYKGLRRIASISVPELSNTDDSNNWITFIPEVAIDKDENDNTDGGENIVTKIKLQPRIVSVSQASASNNGLATANDVREALSEKQNSISDLTTIRNGSRKGASSVQQVKVNDTTITPDSNGIVDLGSIESGGGVVDFANDLTGVVEATPEMFTFRPSAGDKSVRDESAVIRRIKGNTIVWGQYVRNGDFAEGTRYSNGVNTTLSNNDDGSINIVNKGTGSDGISQYFISPIPAKHKVLIVMDFKRSSTAVSNVLFYLTKSGSGIYDKSHIYSVSSDSRRVDSAILETTNDTDMILVYPFIKGVAGEYVTMYSYMAIDLTAIFGAGNEPTTYEEFRQYYPDAYYPYCAPEIRAMRATGIETIGFNAFNGEYAEVIGGQAYYLGGAIDTAHFATEIGGELKEIAIPEDRLYTPSENGYICATGSGICINLSHSGVRNGEYESYEKNTLLLPEIAKYFPDGMHSIGDVYDEINQKWAIQRCATRAYQQGDENNALVKTDKINTVYMLAEPIYTLINETLQLDYKVDDFGTEKMLSTLPSSPFKADIVYQFNAEGRIRDNSRNIARLEEHTKNMATMEDVINAIPTEVAAATQIEEYSVTDGSQRLSPNIMYEFPFGIGQETEFVMPNIVQATNSTYDNIWMLRLPSISRSEVLIYPYTINWKDGIAPNFTSGCTLEIYLKMIGTGAIIGEWKVYK